MEKIILPSTSVMITESCTLRCKLCLAFVPYYKKYVNMEVDEAKKILHRYFSIVDEVEKFSLTGGEPLLNHQFDEILNEVLQYSGQITKEIIIITNGTIRLGKETLQIMSRNDKIKVIVNNYENLSTYAVENYNLLCEKGINAILYTEENRYGWIDCRDQSLKHKTLEECEYQSQHCSFFLGKKYVIKRGKLYTCTRAAYRIQEKIIPYIDDDFIDLLDDSIDESILRERMINLLNLKTTTSCAYCAGLTEYSRKYKAAEQINKRGL